MFAPSISPRVCLASVARAHVCQGAAASLANAFGVSLRAGAACSAGAVEGWIGEGGKSAAKKAQLPADFPEEVCGEHDEARVSIAEAMKMAPNNGPRITRMARIRRFALAKQRERVSAARPAVASREGGFTLFELLVAMSIIALALAALVPAVTSLSKSGGRRAARDSLLGGIERARAEAITSGQATYIVFPTFTSGTQSTLDRYNYRSYAIFEDNAASPVPGTVKQLTDWKSFPTGVALRAAGIAPLSNLADPATLTPAVTFSFTPDTSAAPFRCIKFNSNGQVQAPAANVLLAVFEGYVNNGSEVATGRKDGSGNPYATEYLMVSQFTGRAEPAPSPTAAPQ
jgi:prepilin-type N-terminal cleavage/methylation domain-containing protein